MTTGPIPSCPKTAGTAALREPSRSHSRNIAGPGPARLITRTRMPRARTQKPPSRPYYQALVAEKEMVSVGVVSVVSRDITDAPVLPLVLVLVLALVLELVVVLMLVVVLVLLVVLVTVSVGVVSVVSRDITDALVPPLVLILVLVLVLALVLELVVVLVLVVVLLLLVVLVTVSVGVVSADSRDITDALVQPLVWVLVL